MASRLNHLFQIAPRQFLERTVLFVDALTAPEISAQMHAKTSHCIDLEPAATLQHARARTLPALHLYQDAPLVSYFLPPGKVTLIPRDNPPYSFVFMPEFTCCRLLIKPDGDTSIRLELEQDLNGVVPPPDSQYVDSFAYWDHITGHLVGAIHATAVLVKPPAEPWIIIMQQIVGSAGHELVRQIFTRPLKLA